MAEPEQVKEYSCLMIFRLPDGGYMVQERCLEDRGYFTPPLFACTSMKEALDYIKLKMGKGR